MTEDLDVAVDMLWRPPLKRWPQRSGTLTPGYAGSIVETALNGLRPRR